MFVTPDNYEKLIKIQKSLIAYLETNKGQSNHIRIKENSLQKSYPPFEIHLLHQEDRKCKNSGSLEILPDYVQSADAKVRVYYDHDKCPENLLSALTELIRHYSGKCDPSEKLIKTQSPGNIAIQIGTDGRLDWVRQVGRNNEIDMPWIRLVPNFDELNLEISRNVSTISQWINKNRNSDKQEVSLEDFNFDNKTKLNIQLVLNNGKLMLITDSNPGVRLRFNTKGLSQHQLSTNLSNALSAILRYLPHNSKFEHRDRSKDQMIIEKTDDINLELNQDESFKPVQYE